MAYRSWLFVPGDSMAKMEKAAGSEADALILDLEDSVAAGAKPAAREAAAAFLGRPAPMARFVRVNALDTGLAEADVAAVQPAQPDGYVLPKCAGPEDVETLARLIDAGGTGGQPILPIATETPRAVQALMARDWTHPRLVGLSWGAEDLAAELGALSNKDAKGRFHSPFVLARDAMLMAARAAGVPAIDTVYTDFRDPGGLDAEARAALEVGFAGKLAIHPAQCATINQTFTPSEDSLAWARAVVAAMEAAGGGVAQLHGRMLDQPHLKQARALLARAGRD
ncbi:HpcH/HpaI aldolase/citrate lyase family protein [Palleronia rufa]|uniref:HpcH/HpaI aldolase/citrate lyase family protein n=1 Tax=Palleronia rufa TaxID=1530186 RepID=UPI000561A10E|nr:CoA ester lyase [Palleronia rufa]